MTAGDGGATGVEGGALGRNPRLLLVRHGQTSSNVQGLLDTSLPGAELTLRGRRQAAIVGRHIWRDGYRPRIVYSSEAKRAKQTAKLIGKQLDLKTKAVSGAVEIQAGEHEMSSDVTALLAYNRMLRDWLASGDLESRMPGGENALEVRERSMGVVEAIRDSELESQGRDAVLVIHGALMRCLPVFLGAAPAHYALDNAMPNCGIIELEPVGGRWNCHRWGDLVLTPP